MLPPLAAFLTLTGAVLYLSSTDEPSAAWPVLLIACGLAWAWQAARRGAWPWPALLVLCGAIGFTTALSHAAMAPPWDPAPGGAVQITGTIRAIEPLPAGSRITLTHAVSDTGQAFRRDVRVRLRAGDPAAPRPGDLVRLRALLSLPAPPSVIGGRDMARDTWFTDLGLYGFAIDDLRVTAPGHAPMRLAGLRAAIARRIMTVLPGDDGSIAATLLCGEGSAVPPDLRASFAAAGLAHLLAVAGLHLGIVMGGTFFIARLALALWATSALAWPTRQIAALAAFIAGLAYAALTGANVPVMRGLVMAGLAVIALLAGRRVIKLRAVALAAGLICLIDPIAVMGAALQMSLAAVIALIGFFDGPWPWVRSRVIDRAPPLPRIDGLARRGATLLLAIGCASLVAGGATLPFAAAHFGAAGLVFVPANLIAVPLMSMWILPWGMLALLLMPLHLDAIALVPMGWGIHVLCRCAALVAAWPAASLTVPAIPPRCLFWYGAGLLLLGAARTRALRGLGLVLTGAAAFYAVMVPRPAILVSPHAQTIAIRAGSAVWLIHDRHDDRIVQDQLRRSLGAATAQTLDCDNAACPVAAAHLPTILWVKTAKPGLDCHAMTLVVATGRVGEVCPGVPFIDSRLPVAASLYWHGGAWQVVADDGVGHQRRWSLPTLTLAPQE